MVSPPSYGRLLPDGSEDLNFHGDPDVTFAKAIPRPDGKVVVSEYDPAFNDPNVGPVRMHKQPSMAPRSSASIPTVLSTTTFHLDPAIVDDTQVRDMGTLTDVYVGSGVLTVDCQ